MPTITAQIKSQIQMNSVLLFNLNKLLRSDLKCSHGGMVNDFPSFSLIMFILRFFLKKKIVMKLKGLVKNERSWRNMQKKIVRGELATLSRTVQ